MGGDIAIAAVILVGAYLLAKRETVSAVDAVSTALRAGEQAEKAKVLTRDAELRSAKLEDERLLREARDALHRRGADQATKDSKVKPSKPSKPGRKGPRSVESRDPVRRRTLDAGRRIGLSGQDSSDIADSLRDWAEEHP